MELIDQITLLKNLIEAALLAGFIHVASRVSFGKIAENLWSGPVIAASVLSYYCPWWIALSGAISGHLISICLVRQFLMAYSNRIGVDVQPFSVKLLDSTVLSSCVTFFLFFATVY